MEVATQLWHALSATDADEVRALAPPQRDPTLALPCSPPRAAYYGSGAERPSPPCPPLLTAPCCHVAGAIVGREHVPAHARVLRALAAA
jgi:hypothetical protein